MQRRDIGAEVNQRGKMQVQRRTSGWVQRRVSEGGAVQRSVEESQREHEGGPVGQRGRVTKDFKER